MLIHVRFKGITFTKFGKSHDTFNIPFIINTRMGRGLSVCVCMCVLPFDLREYKISLSRQAFDGQNRM